MSGRVPKVVWVKIYSNLIMKVRGEGSQEIAENDTELKAIEAKHQGEILQYRNLHEALADSEAAHKFLQG